MKVSNPKNKTVKSAVKPKKYLSKLEAAKRLNVHPGTLFKWVRAGKLTRPDILDGRFGWDKDEITALVKARMVPDDAVNSAEFAEYIGLS